VKLSVLITYYYITEICLQKDKNRTFHVTVMFDINTKKMESSCYNITRNNVQQLCQVTFYTVTTLSLSIHYPHTLSLQAQKFTFSTKSSHYNRWLVLQTAFVDKQTGPNYRTHWFIFSLFFVKLLLWLHVVDTVSVWCGSMW